MIVKNFHKAWFIAGKMIGEDHYGASCADIFCGFILKSQNTAVERSLSKLLSGCHAGYSLRVGPISRQFSEIRFKLLLDCRFSQINDIG